MFRKPPGPHKGDVGTERLDEMLKFLHIVGFRRTQLQILASFFFSLFLELLSKSDLAEIRLNCPLCVIRTCSIEF